MKRTFAVFAAFVLAASLLSAAFAADTLEEVKKKGFLAVGVREGTPPMSFLDKNKGQVVGIEVELAEAIAKKIGVPLKLVPILASKRVEALHDGKVDLVAASFSKTPDRAKLVDFSQTYFTTRQRILAKKELDQDPGSHYRRRAAPAVWHIRAGCVRCAGDDRCILLRDGKDLQPSHCYRAPAISFSNLGLNTFMERL